MATLKIIAYFVIGLYGTVSIALFLFQASLLFHPSRLPQAFKYVLPPNTRELFIKTADGENLNAIYHRGHRKETILYFHGNAGDLSGWKFVVDTFAAEGFSVLIIDYRGYGKSSGVVSEKGLYEDGAAAYRYLTERERIPASDIIVYGRSLGTGVAVQVALQHGAKALVLESPYTSLKTLANEKLPLFFPSLYMRFHFNNLDKVKRLALPIVLIHGTADELIPAHHSKKLFAAVGAPKKMILVEGGGHNDLGDSKAYRTFVQEELAAFVQRP